MCRQNQYDAQGAPSIQNGNVRSQGRVHQSGATNTKLALPMRRGALNRFTAPKSKAEIVGRGLRLEASSMLRG